jgi:hypothetical protein
VAYFRLRLMVIQYTRPLSTAANANKVSTAPSMLMRGYIKRGASRVKRVTPSRLRLGWLDTERPQLPGRCQGLSMKR